MRVVWASADVVPASLDNRYIYGYCPNHMQNDYFEKNRSGWKPQPTWTWESWGTSFSQYSGALNRLDVPSPEG